MRRRCQRSSAVHLLGTSLPVFAPASLIPSVQKPGQLLMLNARKAGMTRAAALYSGLCQERGAEGKLAVADFTVCPRFPLVRSRRRFRPSLRGSGYISAGISVRLMHRCMHRCTDVSVGRPHACPRYSLDGRRDADVVVRAVVAPAERRIGGQPAHRDQRVAEPARHVRDAQLGQV